MAFFMDPGAMFLGCLGPSEQKFLVTLIETAAKSGYTRFVEPCAGTFAMANLAVQNGFKPEQIETSDVNMMSTVLGYAITGQSLEPLEIHAQGFSDEELLDPATALYAQLYLRTSKNAGNDYFYQILTDLRLRREEHIESINRQIEQLIFLTASTARKLKSCGSFLEKSPLMMKMLFWKSSWDFRKERTE